MNLRQWQHAISSGEYLLKPRGEVQAKTKFQRDRLTEAVSIARMYLRGGVNSQDLGEALGRTDERAAQMIRLGIKTLLAEGWLRLAAVPVEADTNAKEHPSPSRCNRGRG